VYIRIILQIGIYNQTYYYGLKLLMDES
jgi:hypothetical protein